MQRYIKFKLPFFGPTLSGVLNLNPRELNHTKKETLTAELVDCFGKGSNKCRFGTLKSSPVQNQCPQKPTLMMPLTHKGGWLQERERCGIICSRTQGRIPNSNTVSDETELNNQNHRSRARDTEERAGCGEVQLPSSRASHRGFCICVPSSSGVRSEETGKLHTTSKVNACGPSHLWSRTAWLEPGKCILLHGCLILTGQLSKVVDSVNAFHKT